MGDATVERIDAGDAVSKSADIVEENIEALRRLFPEAFSEDGIDFEVLRQLLGDEVAEGDEKYGLNWHGKKLARRIALTPSMGTLRPCPEESVDWETTQNLMIEGDNLEVLKLLQKSYSGKVKLIYIDPPYNTGKDFVYKDDYRGNIKNYLELTGQTDEEGKKLSTNVESSGRFHTDWLNMMYPRLKLARNLLTQDGLIFISIADEENHNLRTVCDALFGEENFIEMYVWKSTFRPANLSSLHRKNAQYVLCYAKEKNALSGFTGEVIERTGLASLSKSSAAISTLQFATGSVAFGIHDGYYEQGDRGNYELLDDVVVKGGTNVGPFRLAGRVYWTQKNLEEELANGTIIRIKTDSFVPYVDKGPTGTIRPTKLLPADQVDDVLAAGAELRSLMSSDVFSYPKPVSLIRHLIGFSRPENGLVVDFFAGSGTTGHAVMAYNAARGASLRYIMVQLPAQLDPEDSEMAAAATSLCDDLAVPRNLAELTKERLRLAGQKVRADHPEWDGDVGFRVFKLDTSNIRVWSPDRDEVEESLLDYQEHLADDRTEDDILYEMLLKLGLDLCVPIEERDIGGVAVSSVGGGVLLTCLADSIAVDAIEALGTGIAGWLDELKPAGDTTVIFRDSAFENDVAKTNIAAILSQAGVASVRSI